VAQSRDRTVPEIEAVAEGRVYVANDAPDALIDARGGFPDALAWAAEEGSTTNLYLTRVGAGGEQPIRVNPEGLAVE
jgi:ClpP class serine protease